MLWQEGSGISPVTVHMTGDGAGCRVCCLCPEGSCFTKKKHTLIHTHTHRQASTHSPKDTKLAKRASSKKTERGKERKVSVTCCCF